MRSTALDRRRMPLGCRAATSAAVTTLLLLSVALICPPAAWAEEGMCTGPPPTKDRGSSSSGGGGCAAPSDPRADDKQAAAEAIASALGIEMEDGMNVGLSEIKRPKPEDFIGTPLPEPFVIDITATISSTMPLWDSQVGVGCFARVLHKDMDKGDMAYVSYLGINAHTGTHIDMPSHFLPEEYHGGNTVEKVDLSLLMGTVLVMDVPEGSNITAKVLEDLTIPEDIERIIFKTDSTTKGLLFETPFYSAYTGLTPDGAHYLVKNFPALKTVGIDYLSIANYETCAPTHVILFKKKIMVIEGLVLEDVDPGYYTLTCLPLKVAGAEGAPARCILTNAPAQYFYNMMAYQQEQKEFAEMVLAHDDAEIAALMEPDEYADEE